MNPIFHKARELFNWKVEKQARRNADLFRKDCSKNRKIMAVASIYVAVREMGDFPVSQKSLARDFGVTTNSIRNYSKLLVELKEKGG